MKKIIRKTLWVSFIVALSFSAMYLIWLWYSGEYQRCDHRTFSARVVSVRGYNPDTRLYEGVSVYTYPPVDRGNELVFGVREPFKVGEFIDQCINVNVLRENTHPNDAIATTTEDDFAPGIINRVFRNMPEITNI